ECVDGRTPRDRSPSAPGLGARGVAGRGLASPRARPEPARPRAVPRAADDLGRGGLRLRRQALAGGRRTALPRPLGEPAAGDLRCLRADLRDAGDGRRRAPARGRADGGGDAADRLAGGRGAGGEGCRGRRRAPLRAPRRLAGDRGVHRERRGLHGAAGGRRCLAVGAGRARRVGPGAAPRDRGARRGSDAAEALRRRHARGRPRLRLVARRRRPKRAAAGRLAAGRVRGGAGAGADPRLVARLGRVRLRRRHLPSDLPERGDGRAGPPGRLDRHAPRPLLAAPRPGGAGGRRRPRRSAAAAARRRRRAAPPDRRRPARHRLLGRAPPGDARARGYPARTLAARLAGGGRGRRRLVAALPDPGRRPVRDLAGATPGRRLGAAGDGSASGPGDAGDRRPPQPVRGRGARERRRDQPGGLRAAELPEPGRGGGLPAAARAGGRYDLRRLRQPGDLLPGGPPRRLPVPLRRRAEGDPRQLRRPPPVDRRPRPAALRRRHDRARPLPRQRQGVLGGRPPPLPHGRPRPRRPDHAGERRPRAGSV
ncbi:MAG: hypothetical protein AVDCRST_MAG19-3870, partial [uncultured Thermomicrobiales bacterium]